MRIAHRPLLGLMTFMLASAGAAAQEQPSPADLFQKLQNDASPYQSYLAARKLVKLGKSDSDTHAYVALHLPALIERNPDAFPVSWRNAVEIAGNLKIAEACPALKAWVGDLSLRAGEMNLSDYNDLDNDPAALALSRIGDLAIPTLVQVLREHADDVPFTRWEPIIALKLMDSEKARDALRDQAKRETSPGLQKLMAQILLEQTH